MRQVIPPGPSVGLVGVVVLLGALETTTSDGLGPAAWLVGIASALTLVTLLTAGLRGASRDRLTPADRITLTRAVISCGVAALVAGSAVAAPSHGVAPGVLVALASVALVLDAVDGRVARRTGTVHPLGARFDMETDAFLILVLSTHVAADLGWWVLGIGFARYVLLLLAALSRWASWLRGQVPARRWRKAVAAYQGIVLTAATSHLLPTPVVTVAVAAGLGLLVVSFGTEVLTLRRSALTVRHGAEVAVRRAGMPSPSVEAGVVP
ncbi:CDP-alcohol phosphatidyltransferase family protein [Terrabacter carboxydivorans]|uniref:CDP-alcohol phosphatidyltransferase family protein n=1 Tax=Terrabacter carboxydivorans TaxID=619730 RepID=A0ABP5ZHB8_9MICO